MHNAKGLDQYWDSPRKSLNISMAAVTYRLLLERLVSAAVLNCPV